MSSLHANEVTAYLSSTSVVEIRWGLLPERLRAVVGTETEWLKAVRAHCVRVQSGWTHACGGDEGTYLSEMLTASREAGMLYPYHLATELAAHPATRISPFEYYLEMIVERMRAEKSYDTIPSFAAADCVRLVQCGRNEFIHALNACRNKGWLWKRRPKLIASQLAKAPPLDLPVEHWWEVHSTRQAPAALAAATGKRSALKGPKAMRARAGTMLASLGGGVAGGADAVTVEDAVEADEDEARTGSPTPGQPGSLSPSEVESLSRVVQSASEDEVLLAGCLPREVVGQLHSMGLVRFGVPVSPSDRVSVPPLTGFVMNRVGHDYLERCLYELFVSNDESTPLGSLGAPLPVRRIPSLAPRPSHPLLLPPAQRPPQACSRPSRRPRPRSHPRWHPHSYPPTFLCRRPPCPKSLALSRFAPHAAALLEQSEERLTRAASIACRLGFARKLTAPALAPATSPAAAPWDPTWLVTTGTPLASSPATADAESPPEATAPSAELGGGEAPGNGRCATPPPAGGLGGAGLGGGQQRVALLVDSKMAACLMMTNLSMELKQVTGAERHCGECTLSPSRPLRAGAWPLASWRRRLR